MSSRLPNTYKHFAARFPALIESHERTAQAVDAAGPLDRQAAALVKIGICVGAGLESALRAHVRKGRQAGLTEAQIEHAIVQAMNTIGFPRTVAAWSWAQVQFERDRADEQEATDAR